MTVATSTIDRSEIGTLYGVFLPYILSTFGVVLYLRLGAIVGTFGIILTLGSILLAFVITFLTALSASSTATNMHMKGGGAYYILSRSFGIEFGASIGIPLYLAQAVSVAFCIEGFTEVVLSIIPHLNPMIIEMSTLSILTIIALKGSNRLTRFQPLVLALVFVSLVAIFFGTTPCNDIAFEKISTDHVSLWTAFALFFPAVTGLESALAFAENLKSPSRSLPLGTICASIATLIIFVSLSLFIWWAIPEGQLVNDPLILGHLCQFKAPLYLAIFATTLFSAAGSLLNGPMTLQALSKDNIVPSNLSYNSAIAFTSLFIALILYYTEIDIIAPILTMFLLTSYAMINFACGLETLISNPSWRPSFKVPAYLSLAAGLVTLYAMIMIDVHMTLLTYLVIVLFYLLAKKRPITKKLDDIRTGLLYYFTRKTIYYLASQRESTRSWRPNILLFSTSPTYNSRLIDFAASLSQDKGFLTTTAILAPSHTSIDKICSIKETLKDFYKKNHIDSLVDILLDKNLFDGMKRAISSTGLGPLVPNTVLFGECKDAYLNFSEVLKLTHDLGKNAVIIRGVQKETLAKEPYIDIWWDDENRKNCNLMLFLAYIQQQKNSYKNHKVVIKCTAPNLQAKEMRENFFSQFLENNRLSITSEVILSPTGTPYFETVVENSSKANLVFLGLRPLQPGEALESYASYFSSVLKGTEKLPFVAFTMSSEQLNLSQILESKKRL